MHGEIAGVPARGVFCLVLSIVPLTMASTQAMCEELTIEQAVAEALKNNLTLLAERANISIARARLITARLRPNPVLSAGADHLDALGTGFNEINAAGPSEFNLRTDFVLERGGKRKARVEVAQGTLTVTESEFLNAARTLALDVQSAFVDAVLAKDNLAVARENFETLNRIADLNAARVRAGDLAEVELLRSRVAALQQQNAVWRAELAVRAAVIRLQNLMGRSRYVPTVDVAGELRRDPETPPLEKLRQETVENRPDLRALRQDHERAASALRLEMARGKVDWTLGVEYRRQQGINGTGNSLGFFYSVPLPAFDRNQGEIERARQELRQSELRISALEASVLAELENAYQQVLVSRKLLDDVEKRMLPQALRVRQITEYSYKRGQASLLEFLDAQRAFNETMQAYNEARAEYARGLYLLDAVSGKAVMP